MRRILSFVLLAAFGFPVVAPVLALGQDVESALPACCRRDGAHHCSMGNMQRPANSAPVASERCPSFPQPTTAPSQLRNAALASSASHTISVHPSPLVQQPAAVFQSPTYDFALFQRGPPSQHLS